MPPCLFCLRAILWPIGLCCCATSSLTLDSAVSYSPVCHSVLLLYTYIVFYVISFWCCSGHLPCLLILLFCTVFVVWFSCCIAYIIFPYVWFCSCITSLLCCFTQLLGFFGLYVVFFVIWFCYWMLSSIGLSVLSQLLPVPCSRLFDCTVVYLSSSICARIITWLSASKICQCLCNIHFTSDKKKLDNLTWQTPECNNEVMSKWNKVWQKTQHISQQPNQMHWRLTCTTAEWNNTEGTVGYTMAEQMSGKTTYKTAE